MILKVAFIGLGVTFTTSVVLAIISFFVEDEDGD